MNMRPYRGPHANPAKRAAWGEEEQRNERAFPLVGKRGIWGLLRRYAGRDAGERPWFRLRALMKAE